MTEKLTCSTCKRIKNEHACLCTNYCHHLLNEIIKSHRKNAKECHECHEFDDAIIDSFKSDKKMAKLIEMREFLAKHSRKYYITQTRIRIKL
jgi:hypothetical protein